MRPDTARALVSTATLAALVLAGEVALRLAPWRQAFVASSEYAAKVRFLEEHPVDVLVTGDSRVKHGFYPAAAEALVHEARGGGEARLFNGGLSGAPPVAQLALVHAALRSGHPPKLVLVGVSPYMFSSRIEPWSTRDALESQWRLVDLPVLLRARPPLDHVSQLLANGLFASVRSHRAIVEHWLQGAQPGTPPTFGNDGFAEEGPLAPDEQRSRATHRGQAYRTELHPPARFGNEQQGYFEALLGLLREAQVPTVVFATPAASQVRTLACGPESLCATHVAWVREVSRAHGAAFEDWEALLDDSNFIDGDHLNGHGAKRWTEHVTQARVLPVLTATLPPPPPLRCRPLFSFDDEGGFVGWTREGNAFEAAALRRAPAPNQLAVVGARGGFVTSFHEAGDGATGRARSPEFALPEGSLHLRVGGGRGEKVGARLLVRGQVALELRGDDREVLRRHAWEVPTADRGAPAVLELFDDETGGWGHLLVDELEACDR